MTALREEAAELGMPLEVQRVPAAVMAGLGADWILVRPDHIVAATGRAGDPTRGVIATICGQSLTEVAR